MNIAIPLPKRPDPLAGTDSLVFDTRLCGHEHAVAAHAIVALQIISSGSRHGELIVSADMMELADAALAAIRESGWQL